MKKVYNNTDFFKTIISDLEKGDKVAFLVKGTSMLPFLIDGKTEVFLEKRCQLIRYDICLFKMGEKYVLHRLIGKKNEKFVFRGDNSYKLEYVDKADIVACVYQYKNGSKVTYTKNAFYRIKVRCFLVFRKIKSVIRKIVKR